MNLNPLKIMPLMDSVKAIGATGLQEVIKAGYNGMPCEVPRSNDTPEDYYHELYALGEHIRTVYEMSPPHIKSHIAEVVEVVGDMNNG